MKLAHQLLKEFWFPAVAAALWTAVGLVWAGSSPMVAAIKDAAASFFLVSWATGQYFRVKKQSQVESHLNEIVTRLTDVLERIESASDKTVATMTGGMSYCVAELSNMALGSTQGLLSFAHRGPYPLYDVECRFIDLDEFNKFVAEKKSIGLTSATRTFKLGTVAPGLNHIQWVELRLDDYPSPRSYNVHFSARNTSWTQQIRVAKVADRWVTASRIYPPGHEAGQHPVDSSYDDFPRNPDGTLSWDLDIPINPQNAEGFRFAL